MASLKQIWRKWRGRSPRRGVTPLPRRVFKKADVIVTPNEISDRHGTGVILNRIFGGAENLLCIRSTRLYRDHSLAARQLCLPHKWLSRSQSFDRVLYALNGNTVGRVLCVPFLPDELITAIALKEMFNAPLCTFIMDDNNIHARGIPDDLMREALTKSNLRLAISPEMRDAYENKYNLKFWVLPPVVRTSASNIEPQRTAHRSISPHTGILVGNLWSEHWLERLRQTIREAGIQVHWYGNSKASWLKVTPAELEQDGIIDCGFLPEAELTERLRDYPYAIIPSGSLDSTDDRPEIARLSLPTRMPYLLAAGHMPMVVLGSPLTAAARFLERFGVGYSSDYDGTSLRQTIEKICQPARQVELRRQAAQHAPLFAADHLADWIWCSLERSEPVDDRFERAFRRDQNQIISYLESPAPKDIWPDFIPLYHALRRMKHNGFSPDFIVDVGASSGVWSDAAHHAFPAARFILIDPLYLEYRRINDWYFRKHPQFECVPIAVADRPGEADLTLSDNLYGSSLFPSPSHEAGARVKVTVQTLDQVARDKQLGGRGLLKLDIQYAEHLALQGAKQLLPQIDALLVELSLFRHNEQTLVFHEMYELIRDLGFRYYEDVGGWRSPVDGTMLQKDVLFVRNHLFLEEKGRQPVVELNGSEATEMENAIQLETAPLTV